MSDAEELWQQIHESFKHNHLIRGFDSDPQAAMDRVAMKCLGFSFNSTNCTVREEMLEAAALHKLVLKHGRTKPFHLKDPIVVLVYEGKRFVIDGNRRVNKWIKQKEKGPFKAIVVEPHVEGLKVEPDRHQGK